MDPGLRQACAGNAIMKMGLAELTCGQAQVTVTTLIRGEPPINVVTVT